MRLFAALLVLVQCLFSRMVLAEEQYFTVVVAEPYLELHTGPGRGYPVFHVVDRGDEIEVIKRHTDWFKVRTARGKKGWAKRADMQQTLTTTGEPTQFANAGFDDFSQRRWEGGILAGDFDGGDLISAYVSFAMTQNLAIELSASQMFGDFSDAVIGTVNLVAQPFPEWRLSPFLSLGTGFIYTDPNVTLIDESDRTEQISSVGMGVRWYLTRRFLLRAEYKNHVIFQNKDDNQEINEWKAGFAFFF